jgi:hypothetical protein
MFSHTGFGSKPKTSRFSDSQREVLLHLSREKNLDSEKNLRKKRDDGPPLSLVAGSKTKGGPSAYKSLLAGTAKFQLPTSLKMKFSTTPLLRGDIGDGFSEVPAVTVKILGAILSLAIRVILRFTQDDGAVLPRSLVVTLGILNANLHVLRVVGRHFAFSDREAAIASSHLYAVIGDAQTNREAKSL